MMELKSCHCVILSEIMTVGNNHHQLLKHHLMKDEELSSGEMELMTPGPRGPSCYHPGNVVFPPRVEPESIQPLTLTFTER